MSIEIYDKAIKIRKDDRVYFLLKYGSKNSFTCPNQYVIGDNFRSKFLRRESRDSSWSVIASCDVTKYTDTMMADTSWNCPTSQIYGRVMFGNKKNI